MGPLCNATVAVVTQLVHRRSESSGRQGAERGGSAACGALEVEDLRVDGRGMSLAARGEQLSLSELSPCPSPLALRRCGRGRGAGL